MIRPLEPAGEALYRPLQADSWTLGHLGQSLDGQIATRGGDSFYVTCEANLDHLHRLRALADAVIVGAETVARDDPRLTVRRVAGLNPVRVVLDPRRRLDSHFKLFTDGEARTLLVVADGDPRQPPCRDVVSVPYEQGQLDLAALVQVLRARGLRRLFVEGGGRTVSAFLEAGLLDRLHLCVAPLIIGDGRPGLTLPPVARLAEAIRPQTAAYAMGRDVLFDCCLS